MTFNYIFYFPPNNIRNMHPLLRNIHATSEEGDPSSIKVQRQCERTVDLFPFQHPSRPQRMHKASVMMALNRPRPNNLRYTVYTVVYVILILM